MKNLYLVAFLLLFGGQNLLNAQTLSSRSEISFSKIKIVPGTKNVRLTNDYGKRWKMRINFPNEIQRENGLIIALHWAGEGITYEEFNDCLILPGLGALNAIIVSPEGENQLWSTRNNIDKVLSIIEHSQHYWNVDPKKIAVVGYSNGGNGSWYFAEHYPEKFSAAIPMASSYPVNEQIDVPLHVIHGAKDELFAIEKTKTYVRKTKDAGTEVKLVVNETLSHFQACLYAEDLKNAGEWLKELWKEQ